MKEYMVKLILSEGYVHGGKINAYIRTTRIPV